MKQFLIFISVVVLFSGCVDAPEVPSPEELRLIELEPMPALTGPSPSYRFSSNKAGVLTWKGGCSSLQNEIVKGENQVELGPLPESDYEQCEISVRASDGTEGSLILNSFVVKHAVEFSLEIGTDDTKIWAPSEVSGFELLRSRDSDCTFVDYHTCDHGELSVIEPNVSLLDLSLTLESPSYYQLKTDHLYTSPQVVSPYRYPKLFLHQLIEFRNKLWVFGGSDTQNIWYSEDGVNWLLGSQSAPWAKKEQYLSRHRVAVFNDKLWLMNPDLYDLVTTETWSSDDGIQWQLETSDNGFTNYEPFDLIAFKGKLWRVSQAEIHSSIDGLTWEFVRETPDITDRGQPVVRLFNDEMWLFSNWGSSPEMNGYIWKSSDGINWHNVSLTNVLPHLGYDFSLTSYNGQFVAVGLDHVEKKPVVWTSDDGMTWDKNSDNEAELPFQGAAMARFKDQLWIVGGSSYGKNFDANIYSSNDGLAWKHETVDAPFKPRLRYSVVSFENRLWMIGGHSATFSTYTKVAYADVWSLDSTFSWEKLLQSAPFGGRGNYAMFVFDERLWVGLGLGLERGDDVLSEIVKRDLWSTADGINWYQEIESVPFLPIGFDQVTEFDNKLWYVGDENNSIWSSTNGRDWLREVENAPFPQRGIPDVIQFDNKLWLFGGKNIQPDGKDDLWWSDNGSGWHEVTIPELMATNFPGNIILYKNELIGFSCREESMIWRSVDGLNWQQEAFPEELCWPIAVTVHDDRIWVVGVAAAQSTHGEVWVSDDAREWRKVVRQSLPLRDIK